MSFIILSGVVFIAAILQTVTGFGFGLLCVPVFLWLINSIEAIQIVTIVTLIMSIAVLKSIKQSMVPSLLWALSLGCLVGSPIGATLINVIDIQWLKLITAGVILCLTLLNIYGYLQSKKPQHASLNKPNLGSKKSHVSIGVASGILGSALAMPAPIVMAYLSGTSYNKTQIRSTILVYFIIAYGLALGFQMATLGVAAQTWTTALSLSPIALLGVYIGHKLAPIVSPALFRLIIFFTLIITSLGMFLNVLTT